MIELSPPSKLAYKIIVPKYAYITLSCVDVLGNELNLVPKVRRSFGLIYLPETHLSSNYREPLL